MQAIRDILERAFGGNGQIVAWVDEPGRTYVTVETNYGFSDPTDLDGEGWRGTLVGAATAYGHTRYLICFWEDKRGQSDRG